MDYFENKNKFKKALLSRFSWSKSAYTSCKIWWIAWNEISTWCIWDLIKSSLFQHLRLIKKDSILLVSSFSIFCQFFESEECTTTTATEIVHLETNIESQMSWQDWQSQIHHIITQFHTTFSIMNLKTTCKAL